MIAHRKKTFLHLCALLRAIERDKSNFEAVKELNFSLIMQILHDEKMIQRFRGVERELNRKLKNERPSRDEADQLRKRIRKCERIVEKYSDQLFIWRCLGDGLAYAYIDSFNMRQVFFDTEGYFVKPAAGYLSGKEGLRTECALLLDAINHNIPCVLSDITNVVRYGDICLLGDSDPYPIEVKVGRRLNQRGKRQASKLESLKKYLENNVAENFRGTPHTRRVQSDPQDCIEQLNQCIQSARPDGYCLVCPEPGLVYAAIEGDIEMSTLFNHREMKQTTIFILNDEKSNKSWVPYLPFVNSIRDPEALFNFITGKLTLIVMVDAAYLCESLSTPDWRVTMIEHPAMQILFEYDRGTTLAVSRQMYGRLGFELLSLKWLVEYLKSSMRKAVANGLEGAVITINELEVIETDWKSAPKVFDKP